MATSRTVLVVDDDRQAVALIAGLLRAAGYQPLAAYDAVQGMLLANRAVPGLIVLDLQLPAGGGIQMLERLGGSLRTQSIPVLVCSASTQKAIDEYVRRKGAAGFLPKPFEPAQLLAAVAAALG